MCMQDLAISARTQWRPITLGVPDANGYRTLPSSPLRIAVAGYATSAGVPAAWRFTRSDPAPTLNRTQDTVAGTQVIRDVLTVFDAPAAFSQDLYLLDAAGTAVVWEAVMDSDLSKAVQAENRSISTMGG